MNSFALHLLRQLMVGLLVLLLAAFIGCGSGDKGETQATTDKPATAGKTVQETKSLVASLANPEPGIDPVCRMEIDGSIIATVDGKDYGFCSEHCAEKFKANPEKYLAAAKTDD